MSRDAIMARVAKQVANYYASRAWYVPYAELENEAWLHILQVKYDGTDLDKFAGYIYTAASRNVSRFIISHGSPVAGRHSKGTASVELDWTDGARNFNSNGREACPLECQASVTDTSETMALTSEGAYEVRAIRLKLWWHMVDIYEFIGGDNTAELDGSLRVLMDGQKPARAADVAGIPVAALYKTTERLKKHCLKDEVVRDLLGQLHERRQYIEEAQN